MACAKSPVTSIPLIITLAPLVFVTFKVLVELRASTRSASNFNFPGDTDNAMGADVAVGVADAVTVGVGVAVAVA